MRCAHAAYSYDANFRFVSRPKWAKYCDKRVCMFVCLSVCPPAYLINHVPKFHPIFCTCHLRPWFDPSLTTAQYVMYMYFRSVLWMMAWHNGANGPKSKTTLSVVEFARWQSCCLRLQLIFKG